MKEGPSRIAKYSAASRRAFDDFQDAAREAKLTERFAKTRAFAYSANGELRASSDGNPRAVGSTRVDDQFCRHRAPIPPTCRKQTIGKQRDEYAVRDIFARVARFTAVCTDARGGRDPRGATAEKVRVGQ